MLFFGPDLALAKGVGHTRGYISFTSAVLPEFVAKTWNSSVPDPCFEEFIPVSERLFYPVRGVRRYLSWTEEYCINEQTFLFFKSS